jgi:hypothetical protein
MSARKFIGMLVLLALMSACTPATGTDVFEVGLEPVSATDDNQAVKEELQPILRAMLGGMLDEQIAVIQYTRIACATVEGLGGPPPCPEGVTEGTEIEVFPTLGSEGSYIAPENMQAFLNNSIVKSLYAVYRITPNPNLEPYFPEGEYAMLFERNMNDILLPVILQVLDGKVVRMDFRIGISAADLLKEIPVENVLVTPQEAQAWMDSIR